MTSSNPTERSSAPLAEPSLQPEFSHFMMQEIHQQPEAIQTCLSTYLEGEGRDRFSPPKLNLPFDLSAIEQIHIIASGTSRHAGLVAQFWLEQVAHIPTRVCSGSEFEAAPLPLAANTLTIGVTQSGETADTLQGLALQRQRHCDRAVKYRSLGITNEANSSLAQHVDALLPTLAGAEIGVAATKTFTAQLVVFYLLALELAWQRGAIESEQLDESLSALSDLPHCIRQVLQQAALLQEIAQRFATMQHCILLGRGIHHAIALEGALKLKETTYIHAEGYAAGEFMHGPIALLDEKIPVVAIVPSGATAMLPNLRKVKAYGAPTIGIVGANSVSQTAEVFDAQIVLPPVDQRLLPILGVIPLQLLAYHIAVLRGHDVDRPRNITKTLTA